MWLGADNALTALTAQLCETGTCHRAAEQVWGLTKQQRTPKSSAPLLPREAMLCPVADLPSNVLPRGFSDQEARCVNAGLITRDTQAIATK